jgi:hypothetical protein
VLFEQPAQLDKPVTGERERRKPVRARVRVTWIRERRKPIAAVRAANTSRKLSPIDFARKVSAKTPSRACWRIFAMNRISIQRCATRTSRDLAAKRISRTGYSRKAAPSGIPGPLTCDSRGLDPNTAWRDPEEQARFVAGRLKGTIGNQQYAGLLRRMQTARTPGEAAQAFVRGYLRPAAGPMAARSGRYGHGVPGVDYYTGHGKPSGMSDDEWARRKAKALGLAAGEGAAAGRVDYR